MPHQAWKDSHGAIVNEEGSEVKAPIATYEEQASSTWRSCISPKKGGGCDKVSHLTAEAPRLLAFTQPEDDFGESIITGRRYESGIRLGGGRTPSGRARKA